MKAAQRARRSRSRVASHPIRRPAIAKRLGHHAQGHAPLERFGAGRQSIGGVELEVAIDLVHEQVRAGVGGDRGQALERRAVGQHAGRVMRGVDHDEPGRRRHLGPEEIQVERPSGVFTQLVEGDVGAGRATDFVEALVARPGDDRVVAGTQQDVGETEDGFLGAREHEDVVRLEAVVPRRDLAPEQRMTGRFRVAEGQPVPQRARLVVGQRKDLGHGHALDVRGAQEVADGELPAREEPLQGELGDAHDAIMPETRPEPCSREEGARPAASGDRHPGRGSTTDRQRNPSRHAHGAGAASVIKVYVRHNPLIAACQRPRGGNRAKGAGTSAAVRR